MYHSGIGGGGFALIRDKNGRYEAIDFRESAPAAAFENMYEDDASQSITGGLAVAVPSEVRGLEYIHNKYGVSQPFRSVPRERERMFTHVYRIYRGRVSYRELLSLLGMALGVSIITLTNLRETIFRLI